MGRTRRGDGCTEEIAPEDVQRPSPPAATKTKTTTKKRQKVQAVWPVTGPVVSLCRAALAGVPLAGEWPRLNHPHARADGRSRRGRRGLPRPRPPRARPRGRLGRSAAGQAGRGRRAGSRGAAAHRAAARPVRPRAARRRRAAAVSPSRQSRAAQTRRGSTGGGYCTVRPDSDAGFRCGCGETVGSRSMLAVFFFLFVCLFLLDMAPASVGYQRAWQRGTVKGSCRRPPPWPRAEPAAAATARGGRGGGRRRRAPRRPAGAPATAARGEAGRGRTRRGRPRRRQPRPTAVSRTVGGR